MKLYLRATVVLGLTVVFLMAASSLWAAPGDSPANGIAPTCAFEPLAPGASVWLKIPYRYDYRLQFTLDAFGVGGVQFQVYPSAMADNPVGVGTYNKYEPHDLNWEGQLREHGFFYVLVKNTNAFAVSYRFCVTEKLPFRLTSPEPPNCAAVCGAIGMMPCRFFNGSNGQNCPDVKPNGIGTIVDGCMCCRGVAIVE